MEGLVSNSAPEQSHSAMSRIGIPALAPRRDFASSFAVNAGLFSLLLIFAHPAFDTRDDILMMRIASGAYGAPSEYVKASTVFVGLPLRELYTAAPETPWYPFYLYAVHFLSMSAVLYVLLRTGTAGRALLLYLLLFFSFELWLLLRLQYTSTAFVAGTAGLLCILSGRFRDRVNWVQMVCGVLLLVVCAAVRPKLFLIVVALSTGPVVWYFVVNKDWRPLAALAAAGLLGLSVYYSDRIYYTRTPEWNDYYERVSPTSVWDRPRSGDDHAQILREVGWSENDFEMYSRLWVVDERIYSSERLQQYANLTSGERRSFAEARDRLDSIWKHQKNFFYLVLLSLVLSAVTFRGSPLLNLGVIGIGVLAAVFVFAYMLLYVKLQPRVLWPTLLFVQALAFYSAARLPLHDPPEINRKLMARYAAQALAAVVVLAFYVPILWDQMEDLRQRDANNRHNRGRLQRLDEYLTETFPKEAGKTPVFIARDFPFEWQSPFSAPEIVSRPNFIHFGWYQGSPATVGQLSEAGVDDPYRALYERDDVYVMLPEEHQPFLTKFMREHYGVGIEFDAASTIENQTIWKVQKTEPEPSSQEQPDPSE